MPVSKGRKKPPARRTPARQAAPKTASTTPDSGDKGVALYHAVLANETFDDAAEMLLQIVQKAARDHAGKPRHLYLDIDEHKNEQGGWDDDMLELQVQFIGFLSSWLSSWSFPLSNGKRFAHGAGTAQREDVPPHLLISEGGPKASRKAKLARDARTQGQAVYDSETCNMVNPDGTITKGP